LFNQCPVDYKIIHQKQQFDQSLQFNLQQNLCSLKKFHRYNLIVASTKNGVRIVVPTSLQKPLVKWYHEFLSHPGITRLESTIRQQFTFQGLSAKVHQLVQTCEHCQQVKLPKLKYGKIPPKTNIDQYEPWDTVAVDLIGPYTIQGNNKP